MKDICRIIKGGEMLNLVRAFERPLLIEESVFYE